MKSSKARSVSIQRSVLRFQNWSDASKLAGSSLPLSSSPRRLYLQPLLPPRPHFRQPCQKSTLHRISIVLMTRRTLEWTSGQWHESFTSMRPCASWAKRLMIRWQEADLNEFFFSLLFSVWVQARHANPSLFLSLLSLFVFKCPCFAGTQTYAYSSQIFLAYHGPSFLFFPFVLRHDRLHGMPNFSLSFFFFYFIPYSITTYHIILHSYFVVSCNHHTRWPYIICIYT